MGQCLPPLPDRLQASLEAGDLAVTTGRHPMHIAPDQKAVQICLQGAVLSRNLALEGSPYRLLVSVLRVPLLPQRLEYLRGDPAFVQRQFLQDPPGAGQQYLSPNGAHPATV